MKLIIDQTYDISQIVNLENLVSKFLPQLSSKEIIWLKGPLGIGKSEWVRLSLKKMGYQKQVPSPSFSIQNSYPIGNHFIHHIDLYRIQTEADLESIGFFDLFLEKSASIFVEWADRIQTDGKFLDWNQLFLNFKWSGSKRLVHVKKYTFH